LSEFGSFPYSIALVDAHLDLSIQVHPGGDLRSRCGGEFSKTESYYFIEAPTSGAIFCGSRFSSTSEIRSALERGIGAGIADTLAVEAGDFVTVYPGTLHALTAGSFVCEIEENCDVTFRLYDFERIGSDGKQRDLQVEAGLEVLNPFLKSKPVKNSNKGICERSYIAKLVENAHAYSNNSNSLEFCTVLGGFVDVEGEVAIVGSTVVLEPFESLRVLGATVLISSVIASSLR